MAILQNKAGKMRTPPPSQSAQAALAAVELPDDLIAWLPDPDGDASYPIVTYTWLICYKKYEDAAKVEGLKGTGRVLSRRGAEEQRKAGLRAAAGCGCRQGQGVAEQYPVVATRARPLVGGPMVTANRQAPDHERTHIRLPAAHGRREDH